jgi:hypothetical protein
MACVACGHEFLNMRCSECLTFLRDILEKAGYADLSAEAQRRAMDLVIEPTDKGRRVKTTTIPDVASIDEDGDLVVENEEKEDDITDTTIEEFLG